MRRRLVDLGHAARRVRFIRFLATGCLNTAFGYAVYLLGLTAHLVPEVALALATAVGAVFNYVTTARFVFGHRAASRLPVFIMTYALVYAVNAVLVRVSVGAGAGPALAQGMLTPVIAILSYVLFRTFVFRPARLP